MADHRKRPRDPNQLGKLIIDIATGQVEDRPPTPEEQGERPGGGGYGTEGREGEGGKANSDATKRDS
jgi:hypothetical protein